MKKAFEGAGVAKARVSVVAAPKQLLLVRDGAAMLDYFARECNWRV